MFCCMLYIDLDFLKVQQTIETLNHQSELRAYTKVFLLKPKMFLSLSCILKPIKCNESNMIGFSCIVMPLWRACGTTYVHCISENGGPIFRVGIVPEHESSLQEFKHLMLF